MSLYTFTNNNFDSDVINSEISVLIDFWAPWCGPCRIQGPIIEDLSSEFDNKKIKIGKMNIDDNPEIAQKYNIMSIPTIIIFKNGKILDQLVGLRGKEDLKKIINKYV